MLYYMLGIVKMGNAQGDRILNLQQ